MRKAAERLFSDLGLRDMARLDGWVLLGAEANGHKAEEPPSYPLLQPFADVSFTLPAFSLRYPGLLRGERCLHPLGTCSQPVAEGVWPVTSTSWSIQVRFLGGTQGLTFATLAGGSWPSVCACLTRGTC